MSTVIQWPTLVLSALLLALVSAPATGTSWKYVPLHKFSGSDPRQPESGPILDNSGNLYGTTYYGGSHNAGTIYRLAPDGTLTIVHEFGGSGDGAYPIAGLTRDKNGNLYGTTQYGGGSNETGTVFQVGPDGKETVLYVFKGGADGYDSVAGVVKVGRNLYGTTPYGGDHNCLGADGCGIVYKVARDGSETILHTFAGGDDGAQPVVALVADPTGNLYGTTEYGGNGTGGCLTYNGIPGCGTIFKIAPDGTETILHRFQGSPTDGGTPLSPLVLDSAENLYGTTAVGGQCSPHCGTIFKLAPDGTETILYEFSPEDTAAPFGRFVRDKRGNIFGLDDASVFELTADGSLNTLHYSIYPANPDLTMDNSGNLFGTAMSGTGRHPHGSVFEVKRQ